MNEQILEFIGDGTILFKMFLIAITILFLVKIIKPRHNEKKN